MTGGLKPLFAEYKCSGPGFQPDKRTKNADYPGVQLTDEQAKAYTIENILSKNTNPAFQESWMPETLDINNIKTHLRGTTTINVDNQIKVSSNTAGRRLHIEFANLKMNKIDILDISGKLIKSSIFSTKTADINLSSLKAGVYSLKIKNSSYTFTVL